MADLNPRIRSALLAAALALPPVAHHEKPSAPQPRRISGKNRDKIKAARKQRRKQNSK